MNRNSRCDDSPSAEMIRGFEQFNRGEYWAQHETLEAVWRAEKTESIRNFYKGILQIGVGFHHLTRRNYTGAVKVLKRGIEYLRPFAPECMGVQVQPLVAGAERVLKETILLGPDHINEMDVTDLPRVQYRLS